MRVILLIGACGSGKTWVMEQIIKAYNLNITGKVGMYYFHRNEKNLLVLGKYDGSTFQGSDRLSMAVMRDLPAFKKYAKDKVIVCEGDRFTNDTFIKGMSPHLTIIHVLDDGAKGRKKRKSKQTERHIKSIQTRVNNVGRGAKHQCLNSDIALQIVKDEIKAAL